VGKKKVNKYPAVFRKMALEGLKTCRNAMELAAELGILSSEPGGVLPVAERADAGGRRKALRSGTADLSGPSAPLWFPAIARTLRRQGMLVNRKRISRIMREDHLLAIQPKAFVVTTDSDHELEVYLNIASRMQPDTDQPAVGG
jgi:hypothetical protein